MDTQSLLQQLEALQLQEEELFVKYNDIDSQREEIRFQEEAIRKQLKSTPGPFTFTVAITQAICVEVEAMDGKSAADLVINNLDQYKDRFTLQGIRAESDGPYYHHYSKYSNGSEYGHGAKDSEEPEFGSDDNDYCDDRNQEDPDDN